MGVYACGLGAGLAAQLPQAAADDPLARSVCRILLHAIRGHLPGSEWIALCRSHAQVFYRDDARSHYGKSRGGADARRSEQLAAAHPTSRQRRGRAIARPVAPEPWRRRMANLLHNVAAT